MIWYVLSNSLSTASLLNPQDFWSIGWLFSHFRFCNTSKNTMKITPVPPAHEFTNDIEKIVIGTVVLIIGDTLNYMFLNTCKICIVNPQHESNLSKDNIRSKKNREPLPCSNEFPNKCTLIKRLPIAAEVSSVISWPPLPKIIPCKTPLWCHCTHVHTH